MERAPDSVGAALKSLRIEREPEVGPPTARTGRSVVGIILLVVCAGGVAWRAGAGAWLQRVPEVDVGYVSVERQASAAALLTASGYVVAQRRASVSAETQGSIAAILVREGDSVTAGQVIAELNDAAPRAAVRLAALRASVAEAKALAARSELEEATLLEQRARSLVERGIEPRATLEDLTARRTVIERRRSSAEAESRATEAEISAVKITLAQHKVVAPFAGVIVGRPLNVGARAGEDAAPIAEIADPSSSMLEIDVPELQLGKVSVGMPCEFVLDAEPNRTRACVISQVGEQVNRAKASVTVKAKILDPHGVLFDMSARVNFLSEPAPADVPPLKTIPEAALTTIDGAQSVVVLQGDTTRPVPVSVGSKVGSNRVTLLAGPAEGAALVLNPLPAFKDGVQVKLRKN
ncbi:MAG TPA: efflux RND transporter periplasmic adaptor subunit [Polyangiaceae bacterium]|nr:efflux RND transporter periplasmic adaptor subunit [Polyangiaceae bacterium]